MDDRRSRWLALYVLCLGDLMIVLDTNIVNVALPSIQKELGFSHTALAWVVNAYLLTFGGFLLLSGRLGDLYGARRVFLGGVAAFTAASVACGMATSPAVLITGRAVQGLGGAAISAVALALIMNLFTDPAERAKAMGVFGFVMSGGGAVGVLLGGILTGLLTWHWIFWVNLPIGLAVWLAARRVLRSALYLQQVLGYSALQVGLAYLPTSLVMAVCSLWISERLVLRFGIRPPLVAGLLLAAAGLALFARAPVGGVFTVDVLPPMVLLGLGAGIAVNPVLLAAMGDVELRETGLASGVANTSFMMGGALGLAVLVAVSNWRTASATADHPAVENLNAGLQLGFTVGAAFAVLAAGTGGALLRTQPVRPDSGRAAEPVNELIERT